MRRPRFEPGNISVAVSGGFDPIHPGHLELFREAKRLGDRLIVILNTDAWLTRKKGAPFMDAQARYEVVRNLAMVDAVVFAKDDDDTVCRSLETLQPNYFVNAGDRVATNTPEVETCFECGIMPVWLKLERFTDMHSSDLINKYRE